MKKKLQNLGLNKSTIEVYMSIFKDIDKQDPIGWFEKQISMRQPIGSLLPKRAILKHFLIKEKGIFIFMKEFSKKAYRSHLISLYIVISSINLPNIYRRIQDQCLNLFWF